MIQWVIRHSGGLIKDEEQASYVLLGFVLAVFVISMFLIFGRGSGAPPPKIPQSPLESPGI